MAIATICMSNGIQILQPILKNFDAKFALAIMGLCRVQVFLLTVLLHPVFLALTRKCNLDFYCRNARQKK